MSRRNGAAKVGLEKCDPRFWKPLNPWESQEASSNSASKFEFFSFIDTDKQRGKILSIAFRFGIPANDVSYVSAACVRPGFPLAIACGVGSLNGN